MPLKAIYVVNRARYHTLTADNQDYLAVYCLVLNTGLIGFDELLSEIDSDSLNNFEQFIRWVDSLLDEPIRSHRGIPPSS